MQGACPSAHHCRSDNPCLPTISSMLTPPLPPPPGAGASARELLQVGVVCPRCLLAGWGRLARPLHSAVSCVCPKLVFCPITYHAVQSLPWCTTGRMPVTQFCAGKTRPPFGVSCRHPLPRLVMSATCARSMPCASCRHTSQRFCATLHAGPSRNCVCSPKAFRSQCNIDTQKCQVCGAAARMHHTLACMHLYSLASTRW